jgi:hypothetical protein
LDVEVDAVRPSAALGERGGKRDNYPVRFEVRQGRRYSQKTVEAYHVVEGDVMIVVTVYVFSGGGEARDEDRIR